MRWDTNRAFPRFRHPTQTAVAIAPTKTTPPRTTTAISRAVNKLFCGLGFGGLSFRNDISTILNTSSLLLISFCFVSNTLKNKFEFWKTGMYWTQLCQKINLSSTERPPKNGKKNLFRIEISFVCVARDYYWLSWICFHNGKGSGDIVDPLLKLKTVKNWLYIFFW